ncbi:MAG: hypothetical protein ACOQNY_02240 [Mycoplasmoidaceae bacterium]
MKLSNKFIPIITAAGLASVVTPLSLVSCTPGSVSLTDIKYMDEPDFEKCTRTDITGDDANAIATKVYKDFAVKYVDDFMEDMKWGVSQNWDSFFEKSNHKYIWDEDPSQPSANRRFHGNLKELKFGMTTPTFGKVKISAPSTPEQYRKELPTISFKMKVVVKAEVSTSYGKGKDVENDYDKHTISFTCETEYKDVIFFAYLSARNDKTLGTTTGDKDFFAQRWFITTCQDNDGQRFHELNQQPWSISFKANWSDTVKEYEDGEPSDVPAEERTGNISATIDTARKLQYWNNYKDYSWENYDSPSRGWEDWMNLEPQSLVANAILLDNATHYISAKAGSGQEGGYYVDNNTLALDLLGAIKNGYLEDLSGQPAQGEWGPNSTHKPYLSTVNLQLPDAADAPLPSSTIELWETPVVKNSAGKWVELTEAQVEESAKIYEITSDGDASSRHYHLKADDENTPKIYMTFPINQRCLSPFEMESANRPESAIVAAKMPYKLPVSVHNISKYQIYDPDALEQADAYLTDSLRFTIPTSIQYEGKKSPFGLQFTVKIDGADVSKPILDFSEPSTMLDVVLDINSSL